MKDLKMKSKVEIQKMTKDEIIAETKSAQKALYSMKMKLVVGELKQTHTLKIVRRYVALLKTFVQKVK